MLIGFFKKPNDCVCRIIKYTDRIWFSEAGDAEVLRMFIIEVDKNSPEPLQEIRLLLPFKRLERLESVTDTCLLSSSDYSFNSPSICTTREYKIIQSITEPAQYDSFGEITHDGIENIKVFPSIDYSLYQRHGCSVIRLDLPPEKGLARGERTEIRLKFQVTSLFNKVTTGLFPSYHVGLSYFSNEHGIAIADLDGAKEIKVKPILDITNFKGGFDIFLYFPPWFEVVTGFDNFFNEKYDSFNINGKKNHQKRSKLLWRLRELLKERQKDKDQLKLTGIGENLLISGILTKRYDINEVITEVSRIKKKHITTWLTYFAIVLATSAISFSILSIFLKK